MKTSKMTIQLIMFIVVMMVGNILFCQDSVNFTVEMPKQSIKIDKNSFTVYFSDNTYFVYEGRNKRFFDCHNKVAKYINTFCPTVKINFTAKDNFLSYIKYRNNYDIKQ